MPLHLTAACKTDVGKQREQNEDACYSHIVAGDDHTGGIFVVADGMGGYHAGEVASKIAIDTISAALLPLVAPASNQPTVPLKKKKSTAKVSEKPEAVNAKAEEANGSNRSHETQRLEEAVIVEHYTDKLRDAIEEASDKIVEYGKEHPEAKGLGSTVTAVLVIGEQAFIANVGDSRTYLLRDHQLSRITTDHSLVERLVEAGQIEREDVYDHPHRNLIYRSLGGATHAEVDVDVFVERLQPGDSLLLCCDGLWEMVRDDQIASILSEVGDPAQAADVLIERANENGGEDNITAVIVRVSDA
jgi:serine/threonine protein phosphatase PrpC